LASYRQEIVGVLFYWGSWRALKVKPHLHECTYRQFFFTR